MPFVKEQFISNYSQVIDQLDAVKETADEMKQQKFTKIFLMGCGGTFTKFVGLRPLLFEKLSVPFLIVSPEELLSLYFDQIDDQTLIIAGTKTGSTQEILDTLGKVHQVYPETTIYGFIGDDDTLLDGADILDYRTSSVDTDVHLVLFGWFIECYTQMDQDKLVKMRKEILQLGTFVGEAIAGAKEFAQQLIATVDVAKPQMWVTSGRLWGEVCCFCNYILEEIQWIQAQPIHSAEFFHGPFEMVAEDYQVNLIMNADSNRDQDQRVERFIASHSAQAKTVDLNEFGLDRFSKETQKFLTPWFLNHFFDLLLTVYTEKTGKSAKTRRYYRKVAY